MGKSYSIDLRERVQAAVDGGQSRRGAARHYDVSASFAVKLADRVSRTGSAGPARQGRPPPFKKTLLASEAEREDVRQARDEWKAHRQPRMREATHRLIFLD